MDKEAAKNVLTLAAVQMTSTSVLEENLESARAFIDQASAGGADIIALPENFSLMSETEHQRQDAAGGAMGLHGAACGRCENLRYCSKGCSRAGIFERMFWIGCPDEGGECTEWSECEAGVRRSC